jgi:hypothetical protein
VGFAGPCSPAHFSATSQRPERNREKTVGFVAVVVRFRGEKHYYRNENVFSNIRLRIDGILGRVNELNLAETKFMDEIFVLYPIRDTYEKWNHEPLNGPEVKIMQGSLV